MLKWIYRFQLHWLGTSAGKTLYDLQYYLKVIIKESLLMKTGTQIVSRLLTEWGLEVLSGPRHPVGYKYNQPLPELFTFYQGTRSLSCNFQRPTPHCHTVKRLLTPKRTSSRSSSSFRPSAGYLQLLHLVHKQLNRLHVVLDHLIA